jgi:hypothetical protein
LAIAVYSFHHVSSPPSIADSASIVVIQVLFRTMTSLTANGDSTNSIHYHDQHDSDDPSHQVVVIVDPYSTGCLVAKEINLRGYPIVALWTKGFSEAMKTHVPQSCGTMNYLASIDEPLEGGLAATAEALKTAIGPDKTLQACLAGGEAGVDLADALSEFLGLLTNGTDIPNRRDKKIQQELIR